MNGKLTLIQQNDTHAQFEAHPELFRVNGADTYRTLGGYARAATVVRQIREETSGACCFVDCGDAIHGTAVAQWTKGAAVVAVLNAMGVDVMTPGNWEWGFGPEVLRERVAEMKFPTLCCNVERADTGEKEFEPCSGARNRRRARRFHRRDFADCHPDHAAPDGFGIALSRSR